MQAFVIMPFSQTTPEHTESYWDGFFTMLKKCFESSVSSKRQRMFKTSEVLVKRAETPQGNMLFRIINDLQESDLVVAILTDSNPNVFYELALRHSLTNGRTIMLIEKGKRIPFDLGQYGTVEYVDNDTIEGQLKTAFYQRLEQITAYPNNPDNPVQDFQLRGAREPYRSQTGIRVKAVDRMPTEKFDWLPYFFREQDTDKQPLTSTVIAFVVAILNRGSRRVAVDSARLHVTIGGESFQTNELFEEDWVISGNMKRGLNLSHLRLISLAPGEPQILRIAFRLRRALSDDLKTIAVHLELTDSDENRHTSKSFRVHEYTGSLLTRQMADQLYGPESED